MIRCFKWLEVLKWFFSVVIVAIAASAIFFAIKEYREQKILRTTFDNSNYYKSPSFDPLSGKNSIILFGDSRIKQWNPLPVIEGMEVINRGISEETTAQMMLRFKKDVLDAKPSIVIIQAGINDLVAASMADHGLKNSIYEKSVSNLDKIVGQAVKQGITVILLKVIDPYELGLIRSILWGNDLPHLVQQVNNDLQTLFAQSDVHIFDANTVLHQEGQWEPGVNRDALHFTAKAYQLLNDEIVRLVETLSK